MVVVPLLCLHGAGLAQLPCADSRTLLYMPQMHSWLLLSTPLPTVFSLYTCVHRYIVQIGFAWAERDCGQQRGNEVVSVEPYPPAADTRALSSKVTAKTPARTASRLSQKESYASNSESCDDQKGSITGHLEMTVPQSQNPYLSTILNSS